MEGEFGESKAWTVSIVPLYGNLQALNFPTEPLNFSTKPPDGWIFERIQTIEGCRTIGAACSESSSGAESAESAQCFLLHSSASSAAAFC